MEPEEVNTFLENVLNSLESNPDEQFVYAIPERIDNPKLSFWNKVKRLFCKDARPARPSIKCISPTPNGQLGQDEDLYIQGQVSIGFLEQDDIEPYLEEVKKEMQGGFDSSVKFQCFGTLTEEQEIWCATPARATANQLEHIANFLNKANKIINNIKYV